MVKDFFSVGSSDDLATPKTPHATRYSRAVFGGVFIHTIYTTSQDFGEHSPISPSTHRLNVSFTSSGYACASVPSAEKR